MLKAAYIYGVKLAISDDASVQGNDNPMAVSPAEDLEEMFKQVDDVEMPKPAPDNTTKREPNKSWSKGVTWGPKGSPAAAGTLDRFSASADTINVGQGYIH